MAVAEAGISTLGVKLGYAPETSKGVKPSSFTWLERCNSIGGIELSTEQIDASALEDEISRYVQGRQDTGGEWTVTFNLTDEVVEQLESMITTYTSLDPGMRMWFEVWSPYLSKGFYVVAQPPKHIPMPEVGQNELQTVELSFTIEEYKGMDDAIEPVGK
ncbi:MAG: hypothetical protein KBT03_01445 [Bacteroidales bacterium]|nr:hypothetical protein [Candidatus Scybalousia scybalohippi]